MFKKSGLIRKIRKPARILRDTYKNRSKLSKDSIGSRTVREICYPGVTSSTNCSGVLGQQHDGPDTRDIGRIWHYEFVWPRAQGVAEAVAGGAREDEVCYRAAFSKHELRRLLALYPEHEGTRRRPAAAQGSLHARSARH